MRRATVLSALIILLLAGCSKKNNQAVTLEEFLEQTPRPTSVEDFEPLFHFDSRNQDTTLVCWSFSTTSFLESEMKRVGLEPVRLARMYPVYYVFLEKAKRFVQTQGTSRFAPGDLFSGVLETIAIYGIVPEEAYTGQRRDGETFNHNQLYSQLDSVMRVVKASKMWDEPKVLANVVPILNSHLGTPPSTFEYQGKNHTPRSFLKEVVRLPWEEYIEVTSLASSPFDQYTELPVPDNWRHRTTYFNVPLEVFSAGVSEAISRGYSLAIDADISEPSYMQTKTHAIIPPFDIPSGAISQQARQFRLENSSTTDDHLMHLIGYQTFGDEEWYLAKDSWRTAFEARPDGYMFLHRSYLDLKVLAYLVHRDGVPSIARRLPLKN